MKSFIDRVKFSFGFNPNIFPQKPKRLRTFIYLALLKCWFTFHNKKKYLGPFYLPLNKLALFSWKNFAFLNPHHFGELTESLNKNHRGLESFETEVVKKMINLYGGDKASLTGSLITGASEGNLYSIWLGKEKLVRDGFRKVCVLATSLTHESILKASQIMDLPLYFVGLEETFGMSSMALGNKIASLYRKGFRGFIICLTLGYKKTGTSDDYQKISGSIDKLKPSLPKLGSFLWIDAAQDGLGLPFIENKFSPFTRGNIQTITIDFHKSGLVPYTVGLVLLRKKLLDSSSDIQKRGLLESRTALSGIASWALINDLGKEGLRRLFKQAQTQRDFFRKKIEDNSPAQKIVSLKSNTSLTLFVPEGLLGQFKKLETNFPIRCHKEKVIMTNKQETFSFVKVYFLPQLSFRYVNQMIQAFTQIGIKNEGKTHFNS